MEELFLAFAQYAQLLLDDDIREGKEDYIKEARKKAEHLEWHFEDDYPEKLLISAHPGEEPWMKVRRKERWQAPTKTVTGRVFTFLQKIQQADDFKIKYETEFAKTGIVEEVNGVPNTLAAYLTMQFPKYKNAETWLFNVFLKTYLQDSNAFVAVLPDYEGLVKTPELYTPDWTLPYYHIIESEDIVFYDEKAIIWETKEWKDEARKEWRQFLVLNIDGLCLLRQYDTFGKDKTVGEVFRIYPVPFEFEYLPAVKVGNVIYEEEDGRLVFDSVLAPCLPAWNEVCFAADDLAVCEANHVLPKLWRIGNSPCKTCAGTGKVNYTTGGKIEKRDCGTCKGSGNDMSNSPFTYINLNIEKPSAVNTSPAIPPTPPAGYIERPLDSTKYLAEKMEYKEFQGLKAIGLEILGQIPSNQSGIAKEYDRKELNTFCYSVCVHLADVFKRLAMHILWQRYNAVFSSGLIDSEKVRANIPQITVPTDFDVLTAQMIGDMLAQAKKEQFNPIITAGIEKDYVEKLYGSNSYQDRMLTVLSVLDPLPYMTIEEKTLVKDAMGCSEEDFVLSCNIRGFVAELTSADPNWWMKDMNIQRQELQAKATEKVRAIKAGIVPMMAEG